MLSRRETQVLSLVAVGWSNKVIADRLCMSIKTAEAYMGRLMLKLEARNRTHAVVLALRAGLLRLEDIEC